jgi:NAD(P)-dependent dehydrogenase (short-subunit alcohol dehydrogenase family)
MSGAGSVVVIGGTSGLGRHVAEHYAGLGRDVVISGRDAQRADAVAGEIGGRTSGIAVDLAQPESLAGALAGVGDVDHLLLVGIDRDENTVRDYDVERARRLVTLKLVGYTEAIHTLIPRLTDDASIVVFGGLAKDRPYPGSTTVSTVNGGVTAMVRTLAVELAPIRVNALHPAIVGDSPYWASKPPQVLDALRSRTPLGRLVSMDDIAHAAIFLLENRAVTGINLRVDGGWLLT